MGCAIVKIVWCATNEPPTNRTFEWRVGAYRAVGSACGWCCYFRRGGGPTGRAVWAIGPGQGRRQMYLWYGQLSFDEHRFATGALSGRLFDHGGLATGGRGKTDLCARGWSFCLRSGGAVVTRRIGLFFRELRDRGIGRQRGFNRGRGIRARFDRFRGTLLGRRGPRPDQWINPRHDSGAHRAGDARGDGATERGYFARDGERLG